MIGGRSSAKTDAALECYKHGRITSVSAMVFMDDSERAAKHLIGAGVSTVLNYPKALPFYPRLMHTLAIGLMIFP
jgi:hypothetical protein